MPLFYYAIALATPCGRRSAADPTHALQRQNPSPDADSRSGERGRKGDDLPFPFKITLPCFSTLKRFISNFSRPAAARSTFRLSEITVQRQTPAAAVYIVGGRGAGGRRGAKGNGGALWELSEPSPSCLAVVAARLHFSPLFPASPLPSEPSSSRAITPLTSLLLAAHTHIQQTCRDPAKGKSTLCPSFFPELPSFSLTCMAVHSIPSLIAARLERRAGCQSSERRSIKIHERPRKKKRRGNHLQETVA